MLAQRIEQAADRVRQVRWGPRTLDVDVLLVGDERVRRARLEVPHPRLHERAFVRVPLARSHPTSKPRSAGRTGAGEGVESRPTYAECVP